MKSKLFYRGDTTHLKKSRQNRITLNYTFYYHKNFHSNNILTVGHVWRRTNHKNWFVDVEPQVGISRTFINSATYEIVDNKVELKRAAGDWFAVVNIGFSIGKSMNKETLITGVFVKPSIIALLPYNNFIYVRPAIQVGMNARLFKKDLGKETVYRKLKN